MGKISLVSLELLRLEFTQTTWRWDVTHETTAKHLQENGSISSHVSAAG